MKRLLLAAGFLAILARPAGATPVNWEYRGSVTDAVGHTEFSIGTPVTFNWFADPASPNACGAVNPAVGIYFDQHLIQRIGAATYDITGILTVGTNVARGCTGPANSMAELRLVTWSGPSLSDGTPLVPFFPCCTGPGLVWNLAGGAYPPVAPRGFAFQGPFFLNGGQVAGIAGIAEAVPEPATLSFMALGSLALTVRRRRYQSLRASFRSSGTNRTPVRSRSSAAARRVSS